MNIEQFDTELRTVIDTVFFRFDTNKNGFLSRK
jgi:hypothetical protein